MRKIISIIVVSLFAASCSDGKLDEGKLDKAGEQLQKSVQKGTDSIGAKVKRLKDKIDTANNDTLRH